MVVKAVSKNDFAEMVWNAGDVAINFYEENEDGDLSGGYCVKHISFADSKLIISNYYGGGAPFCMDVTRDSDSSDFIGQFITYLTCCGFADKVYLGLDD